MENKDNKIFELHNYLDIQGKPKEIIDEIVKRIHDLDDIGYAGHLEKKWLKMTLERLIPDKEGDNHPCLYTDDYKKKIKIIYGETIKKCINYVDEKVHIFLFPTFDKFAIEKMKGVSGYCPWDNTILIFINFVEGWEKQLEETIVHELAHALSPYAKPESPIGYWLILEGIAENFKDFILPGNQSEWTKAISEKESEKIFEEIQPLLDQNNFEKYSEIFFGTGKYPLWAGYTIGYYLVKRYLEKQEDIYWKELLKINPEKILKN